MAVKFWNVVTTVKNIEDGFAGFVEFVGTKTGCIERADKCFNLPGTVAVEVKRVDGHRSRTVYRLERGFDEAAAMAKGAK